MGRRLAAAPPAAARCSLRLQHHARRQAAWDCFTGKLPSLQQSAHAHSQGPPSLPARPRPSSWHSSRCCTGTESVVDSESGRLPHLLWPTPSRRPPHLRWSPAVATAITVTVTLYNLITN